MMGTGITKLQMSNTKVMKNSYLKVDSQLAMYNQYMQVEQGSSAVEDSLAVEHSLDQAALDSLAEMVESPAEEDILDSFHTADIQGTSQIHVLQTIIPKYCSLYMSTTITNIAKFISRYMDITVGQCMHFSSTIKLLLFEFP